MRYQDFSIRIIGKRDGGYDVIVDSPAGSDKAHIKLPFEIGEALARFRRLGGIVRGGTMREVELETDEANAPTEIGAQLFGALFSDSVGRLFDRSYGVLNDPEAGLRIKLHLNLDDPDVSLLAQLPWELVYESGTRDFLTLSVQTPLVRYIEVPRSLPPHKLHGALRILVVISNPQDVTTLDLDKERNLIEESWAADSNVEVDFLEHPTPETLRERLMDQQYHALHFMGHGAYDENTGTGGLVLEDEAGNAAVLDAEVLGAILRDVPRLRLLFLNACETARAGGGDPFAGVANRLVLAGVPAVIAMQFPISDIAAINFARAFYTRLAAGYPVDEATAQGRRAILAGQSGTLEWVTPVLYMRAPDGRLFDAVGSQASVAATSGTRPLSAGLKIGMGVASVIGMAAGGYWLVMQPLKLELMESRRLTMSVHDTVWIPEAQSLVRLTSIDAGNERIAVRISGPGPGGEEREVALPHTIDLTSANDDADANCVILESLGRAHGFLQSRIDIDARYTRCQTTPTQATIGSYRLGALTCIDKEEGRLFDDKIYLKLDGRVAIAAGSALEVSFDDRRCAEHRPVELDLAVMAGTEVELWERDFAKIDGDDADVTDDDLLGRRTVPDTREGGVLVFDDREDAEYQLTFTVSP